MPNGIGAAREFLPPATGGILGQIAEIGLATVQAVIKRPGVGAERVPAPTGPAVPVPPSINIPGLPMPSIPIPGVGGNIEYPTYGVCGYAYKRRKRMNVLNPRALRRSMRRVQGFAKYAAKTISFTRKVKMKKKRH